MRRPDFERDRVEHLRRAIALRDAHGVNRAARSAPRTVQTRAVELEKKRADLSIGFLRLFAQIKTQNYSAQRDRRTGRYGGAAINFFTVDFRSPLARQILNVAGLAVPRKFAMPPRNFNVIDPQIGFRRAS